MIYHLCLVVGFILPHDKQKCEWELPSIALLSVNKQMRAEARPILYRINGWLLSAVPTRPSPFKMVEPDLFERVGIVFGGDALPDLDNLDLYGPNLDFGYSGPLMEDERIEERELRVQQKCVALVFQEWNEKVDKLKTMKNLRSVLVIFEDFFGPAGCDRMELLDRAPVRRLLKYLSSDEPFVHGRPVVLFCGLRGEKEDNIVYNEYGFEDITKTH